MCVVHVCVHTFVRMCIIWLSVYKVIYTRNYSHCLQEHPVKTNLIQEHRTVDYCGSLPSITKLAGVRMTHWEDDGESSYRDKLFQVFSKIDKDHDGIITRDELRQYCEDNKLDDAIKGLGINQDGHISFEEFYERFKKVTPMLDSIIPQPVSSTPQCNMVQSNVLEAGEEGTLERESIMKKFSIDSDSPLFQ